VELILHAYAAWGEACLQHLSGDFAFALWDGERQRLFCARDQFGVVPFYYARTNDGLVCSNTLDCIRQHPDVSDALNDQAITDHLIFASNPEWDTTRFTDIRRLPPAHSLSYVDGTPRTDAYWTVPDGSESVRYRRSRDYVDHFSELLDQATADRLRVKCAGILMSGGLDSTSIAASAKRVLSASGSPHDLRAYTWVYERLIPDQERHFAGLAAEALGIPIEFLVADQNLSNGAQGPTGSQRSPLQLLAPRGRVMLSGLGGDPAVCPDFTYWIKLLKQGHLGRLVADVRTHVRVRRSRPPIYVRPNVRRWLGQPVWRPPYPSWLRPDLAQDMRLRERLERMTDERLSDRSRSGMLSPFWSDVLANRDPDHTRVPVRVRHPFFDQRLIRFLCAIPAIPWFVDKWILRAALDGVLPDAVRLRPKTPMARWPDHALAAEYGVPAWMEDLARTPELGRWIDLEALWEGLHSPDSVPDYQYQSLVRALGLAAWLRQSGLASGKFRPMASFYA
jgi:asparagine synthase (glutamine-hydrolysing)